MTQLRNWLDLVRIDTLFAALLALGSYPLLADGAWILPTITVGVIFAATMLQNAYDDCLQDYLRGGDRQFAYNHSPTLSGLISYAWTATTIFLLFNLIYGSWWEFGILVGMTLGGRYYTHTRHYTSVSMLVVAAVFTAPLLLGVPELTQKIILNAATFFVFVLAVELRGDLRDEPYDKQGPWKKTLPVALGIMKANWVYVGVSLTPISIKAGMAGLHFGPGSLPTPLSDTILRTALWTCAATAWMHLLMFPNEKRREQALSLSKRLQLVALVLFTLGFLLD